MKDKVIFVMVMVPHGPFQNHYCMGSARSVLRLIFRAIIPASNDWKICPVLGYYLHDRAAATQQKRSIFNSQI